VTVEQIKQLFSETIFWNYLVAWPGDDMKEPEGELSLFEREPDEDGDRCVTLRFEPGEIAVHVATMHPARKDQDSEGRTNDYDVDFLQKLPVIMPVLLAEIDRLHRQSQILTAERLVLGQLASDKPEFFNPLHAVAAKTLRDRVLHDAGGAR
jgi:hypothetical protein